MIQASGVSGQGTVPEIVNRKSIIGNHDKRAGKSRAFFIALGMFVIVISVTLCSGVMGQVQVPAKKPGQSVQAPKVD